MLSSPATASITPTAAKLFRIVEETKVEEEASGLRAATVSTMPPISASASATSGSDDLVSAAKYTKGEEGAVEESDGDVDV